MTVSTILTCFGIWFPNWHTDWVKDTSQQMNVQTQKSAK